MSFRDDLPEIKEGLKARILDLCQRLLPSGACGGRREGRLWVSYNPVTGDFDRSSPELKVALDRDVGAWKCWRSGDKGDVIKLVEYVNQTDFKGALDWSRDFLGLRSMTVEQRRRFAEDGRRRAEQHQRDQVKRDNAKRQSAERLFHSGSMLNATTGTAADQAARRLVRGYFASRDCPLDQVPNLCQSTFRVRPDLEWWRGAEWDTDPATGRRFKVAPGPSFPALLSAMRSPTGQVTAVHCTFLDPLKPGKAPVAKPKLMLGEAGGATIWISDGPEGVPPWLATRSAPAAFLEGIEDGVSVAIAAPELRVGVVGTLSGLAKAPLWLDCISAAIVGQDNDWNNPQALAQFDAAIVALEAHGKPVSVVSSHAGKDFNDLIRGEDL